MGRSRATARYNRFLCATAIAADGAVYTTARIVSPQLYTIRDYNGFLQTSGGATWDIVLDRRPYPVPTTLTVRAAGMNRIDNLLPQVDGTWTVTPVAGDPYRFTLVGSIYGPMYADGGVAYVPGTLIDASPALDAMAVWLRAHGGGRISMPAYGGLYLQSGPLRLTENTIWDCNSCFLHKADFLDQTPGPAAFNNSVGAGKAGAPPNFGNTSKLVVRDLWIYDNRGYQTFGAGQHAINLGTSNSPEKISQWIEFDGVHVRGSAGYGESSDKNNGTINYTRRNGSIKWTDGDSRDRKNTLSLNDSINFQNETHDWVALGDLGTNLRAVRGTRNPFSVASVGSSTVRVAWAKHGFKTGSKVMISGVTQGNGLTIPSTAVTITVTSAGQFTIPATGAALATTTWGGSMVKILPCVSNNGVTTFSGQKYIEVPRSTDAATRIGEKVTLGSDVTLNNVPIGGVWDCIATTASTLRLAHMDPDTGLETGATANASGTGGGDSVTFLCPHISSGDRVIDSRGMRTSLRSIRSSGEFYGRAGITARGGTTANVNGDGAHHISIYDYKFVDLTPAWIAAAGGGGTGLALDSDAALVSDVYIVGAGLDVGVLLGSSSTGSQLSSFDIEGPRTGIQLRGSKHIIGKGKIRNPSLIGVALWGYIVNNRSDLPENAFTPVAIGDPRVVVNNPAHGIPSGTVNDIVGISQTNPVVVTTASPHGMSTGVRVGIKDVVGMTEMNGRVAAFTVLSTTTFSMPIDATGFSAYVSGGKTVNRQVAFSGVDSGSGITILGSNRATYGAVYIDADNYYIDASENVVGSGSLANSTEPFGGPDGVAGYGDTPNTAASNTLDGVEFEHTDVSNTATAIIHGGAAAVTSGQRGRVSDTTIRNCRQSGFATSLTDYDTTGTGGPTGTSSARYSGNVGLYNQLAYVVAGANDGTTTPKVLTSGDAGKTFYTPSTATEQGVFTLPAPSAELLGAEITIASMHATLGAKINANGAAIRILAVSATSSGSVSTTDQGATVTLKLISTSQWVATQSIGTWV